MVRSSTSVASFFMAFSFPENFPANQTFLDRTNPFPASQCTLMSFWSGIDGVYICLVQLQGIPMDLFLNSICRRPRITQKSRLEILKGCFSCVWRKQLEKWSHSEQNQVRRLLSVFVWTAAAASLGFQRTEVEPVTIKDSRAEKPGKPGESVRTRKIRNL